MKSLSTEEAKDSTALNSLSFSSFAAVLVQNYEKADWSLRSLFSNPVTLERFFDLLDLTLFLIILRLILGSDFFSLVLTILITHFLATLFYRYFVTDFDAEAALGLSIFFSAFFELFEATDEFRFLDIDL